MFEHLKLAAEFCIKGNMMFSGCTIPEVRCIYYNIHLYWLKSLFSSVTTCVLVLSLTVSMKAVLCPSIIGVCSWLQPSDWSIDNWTIV